MRSRVSSIPGAERSERATAANSSAGGVSMYRAWHGGRADRGQAIRSLSSRAHGGITAAGHGEGVSSPPHPGAPMNIYLRGLVAMLATVFGAGLFLVAAHIAPPPAGSDDRAVVAKRQDGVSELVAVDDDDDDAKDPTNTNTNNTRSRTGQQQERQRQHQQPGHQRQPRPRPLPP